jgi:hypothetical protein
LSLSLKALEETRSDEAHHERTLFNQTLLPDLTNNIKCGNSGSLGIAVIVSQ